MPVPSLPFSLSDVNSEFGTKSLATHFSDGDGGVGSLPGSLSEFAGLSAFSASITGSYASKFDQLRLTAVEAAGSTTMVISSGTLLATASIQSGSATNPQLRLNGVGSWTTTKTVSNGDTLQIRLTTPNAYSGTHVAKLDLAGYDDVTFSVTVEGPP